MTSKERFEYQAARVLSFLVLTIASVYLVFWLIMVGQKLLYPYQIDWIEGYLLNHAVMWTHGDPVYTDLQAPPYVVSNYTPLFELIWSGLVSLVGPVLWPGRLIALLATLTSAGAIYYLIKHFTADRWAGLLGIGFFLWLTPVRVWGGLARVDMPMICFALLGIAIIVGARPRWRWLAVPMFIIAFFFKQSAIAAPAAAYLYLWLKGEKRQAVTFIIAHALAVGLICTFLQWWTDGLFWFNLVPATRGQWSWSTLRLYVRTSLSDWAVFIALALVGTIVCIRDRRRRIVALYFLVAAALAGTVGHVGAYWNYLIEFVAAGSIILGIIWGAAKPDFHLPRLGNARLLIAGLIMVQLAGLWWRPPFGLDPPHRSRVIDARLEQIVADSPGEILSENLSAVVRAGKQVWVEPFSTTQAFVTGYGDQSRILKMLNEHFFSLLVLSSLPDDPRSKWVGWTWTPEQIQAMAKHYQLWKRVGSWYLLQPKKDLH